MQGSKVETSLRFTSEQIVTLATFAERRPGGLRAEIVTEDAQSAETARIWRHDRTVPLFVLTPLPNGAVEIYDAVRETCESDTIGFALARLQTSLNGRALHLNGKAEAGI